jgi:hypothetical protein
MMINNNTLCTNSIFCAILVWLSKRALLTLVRYTRCASEGRFARFTRSLGGSARYAPFGRFALPDRTVAHVCFAFAGCFVYNSYLLPSYIIEIIK